MVFDTFLDLGMGNQTTQCNQLKADNVDAPLDQAQDLSRTRPSIWKRESAQCIFSVNNRVDRRWTISFSHNQLKF